MAPKKATNWRLYAKMFAGFTAICVGGPALTYWLTPTEEQLFMKYNPDLQRRSLQGRAEREEEFNDFVNRLKEYSKSDKPIWEAAADAEKNARDSKIQQHIKEIQAEKARKEQMLKELAGK